MSEPIIGYENILTTATVTTAQTANGDNVIENAYDWNLSDYWQLALSQTYHSIRIDNGAAKAVDYIAFYSSDFLSGSVKVGVYGDNIDGLTDLLFVETITATGNAFMFTFTEVEFRYYQLTFFKTDLSAMQPKFQHVSMGKRLDVERGLRDGFMPPTLASQNEPLTSKSENGFFLGRSLGTTPARFTLPLNNLSSTWVRANWPALLAHMERYPMFILPQPTDYPEEAIFAWTTGAIKSPAYQTSTYMQVALSLEGFS